MSATPIDPSIGVTPLPMRFRKATKQLATLGPSSSSFEMIEKLFLSGEQLSFRQSQILKAVSKARDLHFSSISLTYFIGGNDRALFDLLPFIFL